MTARLLQGAALLGLAGASEVGLIYSTFTGKTDTGWVEPGNAPISIATGFIEKMAGLNAVQVSDIMDDAQAFFDKHEYIIAGIPTLFGHLEKGRSGTDWDPFMYMVVACGRDKPLLDLTGKKIAIFGNGDQKAHTKNFQDAMGELATCLENAGATMYGRWSTLGYDFEGSRSIWTGAETPGAGGISIALSAVSTDDPWEAGMFVGLALDETNQRELTGDRISLWLSQLSVEGFPVKTDAMCNTRRQLQATAGAVPSEEAWYLQWHTKFTCWMKSLPTNKQQQLNRCAGAMTAEMGNRMGVQSGAHAEYGCEEISDKGGFMQSMPDFPSLPKLPNFQFSAPRMPAGLLPWGLRKWNEMGRDARSAVPVKYFQMAANAEHSGELHAAEEGISNSVALAVAGGAAGALTVGLVALVAGRFTGGSRRNFVAKFGNPTMVEVTSPAGVNAAPMPASETHMSA